MTPSRTGFWAQIPKPFVALAPMADVTDAAFRRVIAGCGKPDLFYTEFVSCDGLCSAGRSALLQDLMFSESERPILAQIFGATPGHFNECAKLIAELGFDGIDINMGCPDKHVEAQRAGAALLKDPSLARELIEATREGAPHLPVSIKTRLGYAKMTYDEFLPEVMKANPAAIALHARTRKEMSLVPAHWDDVRNAADLIRSIDPNVVVLGNGDVTSLAQADEYAARYRVDGVMIGRGIFGNPWFFNRKMDRRALPLRTILETMVEHARLYEQLFKGKKNFAIMKKHFKAYTNGFPGAKAVRVRLMAVGGAEETAAVVAEFLASNTAK